MERCAFKWRKKNTSKEKALNLSNTFQFVFTTDSHVYMQDMQRSKLDQRKTSCWLVIKLIWESRSKRGKL